MSKTTFVGAARAFTDAQLGGPTTDLFSNPTVNTTPTLIAKNSPDRVGLVIFNTGANDILVGLDARVSSTFGIKLPSTTGNFGVNVRDDWTLSSHEWWGIALVGASVVTVFEVVRQIYTPEGEQ